MTTCHLICYVNLTSLPLAMNLDESWPRQDFRRPTMVQKQKLKVHLRESTPTLCMYNTNWCVLFSIGPYWLHLLCAPPQCKLPTLTFTTWIFKLFGFLVIDLVLEIGFWMIVVHVLNMIATRHGTKTFAGYLQMAERLLNTLRCSHLDILKPPWTDVN